MKKTFRSILAGALALLAVSCYDDTDLQDKYGDLNDRVSAIENTLNAEVGGINDLLARVEALEGKIAAIKVETSEAGVTTLTLSDNSKVVLSQKGVVTVKAGVWYTVDPKTGAETVVGKVGHKLDFKVENGVLMYKPEGESNYTATEVKVSDYTAHVIGNVVPAADGKSVAVTIGDQTLELPLVSSAVATLGLSRDSFFLRYTAEKVVEITATNINDVYVMNQPDGWNATIEDDELVITAPTKKAIQIGAAQAKGLVLVHATDEEGKCVVAKIEVESGEGLTISVDADGKLVLRNAYTSLQKNEMMESEWFGFTPFHVALVPASYYYSFEQYNDGLSYEEAWNLYGEVPYGISKVYSGNDMGEYVEGRYEVDVIETTVQEFYYNIQYSDLPYGAYVLVAASDNGKGLPADGLQVVEYLYFSLNVEVASVSHNDIKVKVDGEGAYMYLVGGVPQSNYLEGRNGPTTFDKYMTNDSPMSMGPWAKFVGQGYLNALGTPASYFEEEPFEFSPYICESYGAKMNFDSAYDIWVMPIFEHMIKYDEYGDLDFSAFDYEKHFKPYVITGVKTSSIELGEVTPPTIVPSSTYTKVYADITPAAGTTVYYSFISQSDLLEFENKKEMLDYLLEECYSPLTGNHKPYESVSAGEVVILLTATISDDGKYAVADQAISALSYPSEKNDALTITLSDATVAINKISVDITPAANTTYYYDYVDDAKLADDLTSDAKKLEYLLTRTAYTTNTTATVQSLMPNTKKTLLVAVVDADNKYNLFTKEATTSTILYNEAITVEPVSVTMSGTTATVKVKVTGNATKVAFNKASPGTDVAKTNTEIYALSQDPYGNVTWGDVDADGFATATIRYVNANYTFYAVACIVDGANVSISHAAAFLGTDYPAAQ